MHKERFKEREERSDTLKEEKVYEGRKKERKIKMEKIPKKVTQGKKGDVKRRNERKEENQIRKWLQR